MWHETDPISVATKLAISFFIINAVAETMTGLEPHKSHVFGRDDTRIDYEDGLSEARLKAFRRALGPGAGSEVFQTSMLNHLKSILDNIETSGTNKVDLYANITFQTGSTSVRISTSMQKYGTWRLCKQHMYAKALSRAAQIWLDCSIRLFASSTYSKYMSGLLSDVCRWLQ